MSKDGLNIWCSTIVEQMFHGNIDVLLLTARPEGFRSQTVEWLRRYQVPFSGLFMRLASDHREDTLIKAEIYEHQIMKEYNVLFALEDRKRVAEMWRDKGLVCLQCAEGDY